MNILPIEFRVLGGMWCGDVVALNGSETTRLPLWPTLKNLVMLCLTRRTII
jgi:hypothetical protein